MEIVLGGRGQGKTTLLIKKSAETQTYILVTDRKRQRMLADQARAIGIDNMPFPVTVADMFRTHNARGSFINKILVDDADDILKQIFYPLEIDTLTMSSDGLNKVYVVKGIEGDE